MMGILTSTNVPVRASGLDRERVWARGVEPSRERGRSHCFFTHRFSRAALVGGLLLSVVSGEKVGLLSLIWFEL